MRLVAIKRISEKRPMGCEFDEPNPRAKMLIAIGLAKPYEAPVVASADKYQIPVTEGGTTTPHPWGDEPSEPPVFTPRRGSRRGSRTE
jgi:hypothetical protein